MNRYRRSSGVVVLLALLAFGSAWAGEFGLSYAENLLPGECEISMMDTKVTLSTDSKKAWLRVGVRDHEGLPVVGARVYVEWSTRDGKLNYCTTKESGECTLTNTTEGGKNAYPLYVRINRVQKADMTYVERENSKEVWVICPDNLKCD